MSDASLRERQRAWESTPGDQEALAAYIAALRSAGEPVRPNLLAQRVFPPRLIQPLPGWSLSATSSEEPALDLAPQPDGSVLVPEHRSLWVSIKPSSGDLEETWAALAEREIRNVEIECAALGDTSLAGVNGHPLLEELVLEEAEGITGAGLAHLAQLSSLHSLRVNHDVLEGVEALRLPSSLWSLDMEGPGVGIFPQVPDAQCRRGW